MAKTSARHPRSLAADRTHLFSGRYRLGASDIPARSHFLLKPYNLDVIVEVLGGFVG